MAINYSSILTILFICYIGNNHLALAFVSKPTCSFTKCRSWRLHSEVQDFTVGNNNIQPSQSKGNSIEIVAPQQDPRSVPDGDYPSVLHSIHVVPLLTDEEAAIALRLAKDHAAETNRWNEPDFERHSTYATVDFPVEGSGSLEEFLGDIDFDGRLFGALEEKFGVEFEDMNYLDFFCANYEAKQKDLPDRRTLDSLEFHRDGGLLSFNVVLTPPDQFEGGGTSFDTLRDVVPSGPQEEVLAPNGVIRVKRAGDCILHCGKMLHGADKLTSGQRTVLVGFVDVANWCQRERAMHGMCRELGRMDNAMRRKLIQDKKTNNGKMKGWELSNKFSPDSKSVLSFCPYLDSVEARADPEYQRQKRLNAEDILLRRVLVPETNESKSNDQNPGYELLP